MRSFVRSLLLVGLCSACGQAPQTALVSSAPPPAAALSTAVQGTVAGEPFAPQDAGYLEARSGSGSQELLLVLTHDNACGGLARGVFAGLGIVLQTGDGQTPGAGSYTVGGDNGIVANYRSASVTAAATAGTVVVQSSNPLVGSVDLRFGDDAGNGADGAVRGTFSAAHCNVP